MKTKYWGGIINSYMLSGVQLIVFARPETTITTLGFARFAMHSLCLILAALQQFTMHFSCIALFPHRFNRVSVA